jgi:hypothetical protein
MGDTSGRQKINPIWLARTTKICTSSESLAHIVWYQIPSSGSKRILTFCEYEEDDAHATETTINRFSILLDVTQCVQTEGTKRFVDYRVVSQARSLFDAIPNRVSEEEENHTSQVSMLWKKNLESVTSSTKNKVRL